MMLVKKQALFSHLHNIKNKQHSQSEGLFEILVLFIWQIVRTLHLQYVLFILFERKI